ncbi:MAG: Exodeoxyribonuclease 7 small subunit [Chlamydiae bacterium]|nr:Exodeoxyribonuclease 7 small subunit [Chlamydiota bacterium]
MKNEEVNFEQAFERLEEILEKMNASELSLNQSLSCYEEANSLIQTCEQQLKSAEKKVQALIKNRNQEIQLDDDRRPQLETFQTENEKGTPAI